MKKRILALCMAVAVTFTTVTSDVTVYAGQSETVTESETESGAAEDNTPQIEDETETETQELESTEEETNTQELESTEEETNTQELESTEEETQTQELESTEEETQTPETEQDKKEAAEKLNYLSVGSPYVELPGTQKIVADFGDEDTVITSATMVVQKKDTLETQKVEVSEISDTALLFELAYQDESSTGVYKVVSLHVETKKGNYDLNLEEIGIDAQYGVNQSVDTKPDSYVVDEDEEEDISSEIVSIGPNGEYKTETTLEDALESVQASSDFENVKGNLVVCLDPGHGGYDGGASANGLVEKNLNLKIAQYVKEELETYSGVTVYMTRTGDNYLSLDERGAYAQQVGANVFVSIHINSGSSVASGAEVYYPNGSYNPTVGAIGHDLAEKILAKLVALGLANRGTKIRNSESGDTYDDGSLCDYYGVIRRAKKAGIPGLIVEHAFVSNASDASNFLNSDEKLKALGVADATGIAEYYGLVKKSTKPTISYTQSKSDGSLKIKWTSLDNVVSYALYRSTSSDGVYDKVAEISGTSYTDKTVTVGTKYYYRVSATFSDGTVGSQSDVVSGRALKKVVLKYVRSKSSKKLEIKWSKVSGASGYYVYRKNDSTQKYELIKDISSGSTCTYTDKVEKNNTKYKYMVKAYSVKNNVVGTGKGSETVSGKAIGKTTISSVVSTNRYVMKLTWSKVKGATGYEIVRSEQEMGGYEKIATIKNASTLTYNDKIVSSGKVYYYKIQAYVKSENATGYSGYTAATIGKTVNKTHINSVSSADATTLKVTWEKVSGATGYVIKRSDKKDGNYKTVAKINSGKKNTYMDSSGITTNKKYYYKIESLIEYNGVTGRSGNSGAVWGKTIARSSINYVVSTGSNILEVSWSKVKGASAYQIKRCDSKKGSFKTIATVDSNIFSYEDRTVSVGKTYYYKIQVVNNINNRNGYSGNCSAVSGKTIKNVVFSEIKENTSNSLTITWEIVKGVSGYRLYRSEKKNGTYKKIKTLKGSNSKTYVDNNVEAGKTYYYKIRAYKDNSKKTEVSSYTKVKAWTVKRAEIAGVKTSNGNKITLTWKQVNNASGYSIYRKLKTESSFSKVGNVLEASTTEYTDKTVEAGKVYCYRICANSSILGKKIGRGTYSETWTVPLVEKPEIISLTLDNEAQVAITWAKVSNASGYQLSYSTSKNGTYTSLTKTSSTSYTHTGLTSGSTYYYKVRAYVKLADGSKAYGAWSSVESQTVGYPIMGSSDLTVEDMLAYYNKKGYTYPTSVYTLKGASSAKKFFEILKEEAEAEGVRTEVLFAQAMHETGGLQFGGDVKAEQCNFGGMGATGNGVSGETFKDVRTGLRAQVQHLKAYASKEELKNPCEDSRFKWVTRGTAPYIEWLSIPNNPYGKGWATDSKYAAKLLNIINSL